MNIAKSLLILNYEIFVWYEMTLEFRFQIIRKISGLLYLIWNNNLLLD